MISRTARNTLLILSLIFLIGAFGCSNSTSPTLPAGDELLASANNTTGSSSDEERQVAEGLYTGTLTDPNSDPLAYAELYLDDELAGWTDEDGSFEIYGVDEEAEYDLEARIDDDVIFKTIVTPATRNAQELGDEDPNVERGTVWGFVRDQLGPVPHAFVVVFNSSENFGADFTNDEGYFEINDAPAGPGRIVAFAPEHATARDGIFVIAGGEVQKNLFMPARLDFGVVAGRVVTGPPLHMKPVAHATVGLRPANAPDDAPPIITRTNRHGVYVMRPVPLGPANMKAQAVCFNEAFRQIGVHPGRNFAFFHLEPGHCGGIEGQVTDPDGEPIMHAKVRVVIPPPPDAPDDAPPHMIWELTGPLGFYRFDPIPPGLYGMNSDKFGYLPWHHEGPVTVFPDQFTVVDIILEPDED